MIRALTAASTGLEAQQANIERISNDIANVNTDGYKRSRNEFQDLMYETIKDAGGTLGANSQSPVGVQRGMGVKLAAEHKLFEPGSVKATNHEYDLMIEGKGFFPVTMPNGEVAFTRNGAFKLDNQRILTLSNGAKLIPQIVVPQDAINFMVTPSGEVRATLSNLEQVGLGQIQVASFSNEQGLAAVGGSTYMPTVASGPPIQLVPGENGAGSLLQGALEGSNVNIANSMVDMISTQRAYEMNTKVMGVADQMLQATVNIK